MADALIEAYAAAADAIEALPRRLQFAVAAVFLLVLAGVLVWLVP